MIFDSLRRFRQQLYSHLGRSKAALFDLMDAALTTPSPPSFAHLSLSPVSATLVQCLQGSDPPAFGG